MRRSVIIAALRLGGIWGFSWGAVGGIVARVVGVHTDLPLPLLFAALGTITGLLSAAIIAVAARRRSLAEQRVDRFAAWGAGAGAALGGVIVATAAAQGRPVLPELLLFGVPLTIGGAASTAGSLVIARRALGSGPARPRAITDEVAPDALEPPPVDSPSRHRLR